MARKDRKKIDVYIKVLRMK